MRERPVAIVSGLIIRQPVAGLSWAYLNWLLGVRDLGFEPVYMEAPSWQPCCYDVDRSIMTDDPSYGIAYLERELARSGLGGTRWWYADEPGHGMTKDEAIASLDAAQVFIDVSATSWCPDFERAHPIVLVDTDAPFTQIRLLEGDEDWQRRIDAHDFLSTYAVNLADARRHDLSAGRQWLPARPPLHLDSWMASAAPEHGRWTTVAEWDDRASAWWELEEYRQKGPEFAALRDLPRRSGARFRLGLGGHPPWAQLASFGFDPVPAVDLTHSTEKYEEFVRGSRGEIGVARHGFIKARTGAVNDRTLVYLAAGRPAVVSDTGLDWLPTGQGLLTYSNVDDAVKAIRDVEADYAAHAAAARLIVEKRFSAVDVARDLLDSVGLTVPS